MIDNFDWRELNGMTGDIASTISWNRDGNHGMTALCSFGFAKPYITMSAFCAVRGHNSMHTREIDHWIETMEEYVGESDILEISQFYQHIHNKFMFYSIPFIPRIEGRENIILGLKDMTSNGLMFVWIWSPIKSTSDPSWNDCLDFPLVVYVLLTG